VALARGEHERLGSATYTFARQDRASGDRVVVALGVAAGARVPVGRAFADGDSLLDAYSGRRLTVSAGHVTVDTAAPAVLLEAAP
ncbi:MAG TPA: alpha-amylase, partial [Burkholderiaceae bacterium]|nr:alpha-amylase [Burkholderiaceae bacterium]